MGQTLYLECNSGISGDMIVAALLDLGADENVLRRTLSSMPVSGFEIQIDRVKKAGLDVCNFDVKLEKKYENHDHDMEYLHGHEHMHSGVHNETSGHSHSHTQEAASSHIHSHELQEALRHSHSHAHNEASGHSHSHAPEAASSHIHSHEPQEALRHSHSHAHNEASGHSHSHTHRGLAEIQEIIRHTDMTEHAKTIAMRIFHILAAAEAKAHGTDINNVHFHEVGAIDSIADIVAAAVCLDNLNITEVILPYLCEGKGTIRCQHGILPIPVPAVINIVQANGLTLKPTEIYGELVTPTGAAIAAAVRTSEQLPETFKVLRIGMGAGKRNYERPSILRAMLIQPENTSKADTIYKLETNIDDCTGEMLGYVIERLFEIGARDVFFTPVFMKKNRPAYQLTVICQEETIPDLEAVIFRETTTIGIRKIKMERRILQREIESVALSIGEMKLKKCTLPNGEIKKYPEYESAAELAKATHKSLQDILNIFQEEIKHE